MTRQTPLQKSDTFLVVDAPASFDLLKALKEARRIWVASAFAHKSGWIQIRDAILASNAKTTLISGLDFCQTEPWVLRDWIGKVFSKLDADAYLYVGPETFHPKIFVVKSPVHSFALVGSGNLSAGGLGKNVECFAYISKSKAICEVEYWLETVVADRERCVVLSSEDIHAYEKKWKAAAKSRKFIQKQSRDASIKIATVHKARLEHWRRAVSEAKAYFKSSHFDWHAEQKKAARYILKILHHPHYDFDRDEWSEFYKIWNMGHLIPIYKYRVYKQRRKLIKGLCLLADKTKPVAQRVDAILESSSPMHVTHLGINAVTKILASIEPKRWPVWNNPVKRSLSGFGYKSPRGASPGQKYAAFAEIMSDFKSDTEAPDMLALDCFFFWKDKKATNRRVRKRIGG